MRPSLRVLAILAAAPLALACQKPDVGARCTLTWNQSGNPPPPTPATAQGDYFDSGNIGCDDLVCIVSPAEEGEYASCEGTACGYCSKPCVSDQDCYRSETGLVCRQIVLDPAFIEALPPEVRERYLGDVRFSSYCAVPQ
jgi:hypothetical protein